MIDIWHNKKEKPKKLLHCTRLIVTKWGSVYSEKDIDNGAFIETDWAYLDDLLALETELTKTKQALDVAVDALIYANKCIKGGCVNWITQIDKALDRIKQITAPEQKESVFVHNKIEFPEYNDGLLEEFDKQFFENGQDDDLTETALEQKE